MSNSLSARVQLQGNLHAARGELLDGMMDGRSAEERAVDWYRGRGYKQERSKF